MPPLRRFSRFPGLASKNGIEHVDLAVILQVIVDGIGILGQKLEHLAEAVLIFLFLLLDHCIFDRIQESLESRDHFVTGGVEVVELVEGAAEIRDEVSHMGIILQILDEPARPVHSSVDVVVIEGLELVDDRFGFVLQQLQVIHGGTNSGDIGHHAFIERVAGTIGRRALIERAAGAAGLLGDSLRRAGIVVDLGGATVITVRRGVMRRGAGGNGETFQGDSQPVDLDDFFHNAYLAFILLKHKAPYTIIIT